MRIVDATPIRESITSLFASGCFAEGIEMLSREAANLPEPVRLECSGNLHFYRRELQDAIRDYEAAITLAPDYGIARYQYLVGVEAEKQRDFVSAFKRYQYAIEIEPTFIDSYIELGGLLVKVGDFEGAAQCYRDAVRLAPGEILNAHNLLAVLTKLADNEPAKYGAELSAIRMAYEDLLRRGHKLPDRRTW